MTVVKYEVRKLNGWGKPDFNSNKRTFQTTEKELYTKLASELKTGGHGFYIYQESNNTSRILKENGGSFIIYDIGMRPISKFTIQSRAAPKPRAPASKGAYSFSMESENPHARIRSYNSPRYETWQSTYAHAYQQMRKYKGNEYIVCTFYQNGDMPRNARTMAWDFRHDCFVLTVYGKRMGEYRVYSDGRLKKL